jgi:hypothetical protein
MITYTFIYGTCLLLWNYDMELRGGGKGKQNDRTSTILKYITSRQVQNIKIRTKSCSVMGGRRKRVRESNVGVELTRIKYIHSLDASRNPCEH